AERVLVQRNDRVEYHPVDLGGVEDAVGERELGAVGASVQRDLVEPERLADQIQVTGGRACRIEVRGRAEPGGACGRGVGLAEGGRGVGDLQPGAAQRAGEARAALVDQHEVAVGE